MQMVIARIPKPSPTGMPKSTPSPAGSMHRLFSNSPPHHSKHGGLQSQVAPLPCEGRVLPDPVEEGWQTSRPPPSTRSILAVVMALDSSNRCCCFQG